MGTRRAVGQLERQALWAMWKSGTSVSDIARALDRKPGTIHCLLTESGGIPPSVARRPQRALTLAEREEISRGIASGASVRSIAATLNRAPSTISRELIRNGGRGAYRAVAADDVATAARRRPKLLRLVANQPLCRVVTEKLSLDWSPEQVSGWLRGVHGGDPSMQISHESIYRALYLHERSGLRASLRDRLRTRRRLRRSRHASTAGQRRGQIVGAVPISERPAHVEQRREIGHWEGDLIAGGANTYIATLVERASRFTVLARVDGKDTNSVIEGLSAAFEAQPRSSLQSLTWDRGTELARHTVLAARTGLAIYFCDPKSPWQRGSNENTNRLLRQYFPKGMRLDHFSQSELDATAARLNTRPRKVLSFKTPEETFHAMLH